MNPKAKVTVSCGTKFHSDYMGYQLQKRGLLDHIITAHPSKYYLNRVPIERKQVKFLPPIFVLPFVLIKMFGKSNSLANWLNYRLPLIYDRMAALSLNRRPDVLITWAWSGLNTIRKVQERGGVSIVEECGSCNYFQNRLLQEEYNRLGLSFENETPSYILKRQLEEAKLADLVLCPSNHVARSFIEFGVPSQKCHIIPYGANIDLFYPKNIEKKGFEVLFVGTVGVRKGLVYLFQALQLVQGKCDVACTIIGKLEPQFETIFNQFKHLFHYIPKVPHHELVDYYNRASVFVFPSLDEGMALVQLEALACGLPVVCTYNSGGDSVINDGVEGYVVPIRKPEILAEKIEFLYHNPTVKKQMSRNARAKAIQFSWDQYGEKLAELVQSLPLK